MKIKFTGPKVVRREVAGYTWSKENGHVVDVHEAELCAELVTTLEFGLADDEPLTKLDLNFDEIGDLLLFGICSLEQLATLNKEGINALAGFTDRSEKDIRSWVTRSKKLEV